MNKYLLILLLMVVSVGCSWLPSSPEAAEKAQALSAEMVEATELLASKSTKFKELVVAYDELKAKKDAGELDAGYFMSKAPSMLAEVVKAKGEFIEVSDQVKDLHAAYKDLKNTEGTTGGDLAFSVLLGLLGGAGALFPRLKGATDAVGILVGSIGKGGASEDIKKGVSVANNKIIEKAVMKRKLNS